MLGELQCRQTLQSGIGRITENLIGKEMRRIILLIVTLHIVLGIHAAADTTKIDFAAFKYWNKLLGYDLSSDGQWVYWRMQYNSRTDTLFVQHTENGRNYKFASASMPEFSKDGKWIAFSEPTSDDDDRNGVSYQITLLNLLSGVKKTFWGVERFSFAANKQFFLLLSGKGGTSDVTLYNLETWSGKPLKGVSDYCFSPDGRYMAYFMSTPESEVSSQMEILDLKTNRLFLPKVPKGNYTKMRWTAHGVVLLMSEPEKDVIVIQPFKGIVKCLSETMGTTLPEGMEVSLRYTPVWTDQGRALFFGLSHKRKQGGKAGNSVEIWHWKDEEVFSRQQNRYYENISKSKLCIWKLAENSWRILEDSTVTGVIGASADGNSLLCVNDVPYRPQFREPIRDIILKDTHSGLSETILKATALFPRFSDGGKYVFYFQDGKWVLRNIRSGKQFTVSPGDSYSLIDNTYDGGVEIQPSWGYIGFTNHDKTFLFYDEYDIWSVSLPEMKYKRLTNGREQGVQFRKAGRGKFELSSKQILFGKKNTGETGFYRFAANAGPQMLVGGQYGFSRLIWNEAQTHCIFAREENHVSPALYYMDGQGRETRLLVSTQKGDSIPRLFKSRLVKYHGSKGEPLQGALFYPADYQEGKSYPMVVHLYERLSKELNHFTYPSPREAYNAMNYVLHGYFVFQPDISYVRNHPGESAVDCIRHALRAVYRSCTDVDSLRVGVLGHSWGAYQSVFFAARTSLFAAAIAGAPLVNMQSMYNSIYWENGKTNQELFETGQARLRQPWWDIPDAYRDNSPLYFANDIKIPLLLSFGKEDKAVDWAQGLELYLTMRRLGKPCIMLAYPDEGHTISMPENEEDQAQRFMQFFNTYLKHQSAPKWITQGRSYMEMKSPMESRDKQRESVGK
jgi:dipeptidyl aminopeptidase/acylaminoacyl peptidase